MMFSITGSTSEQVQTGLLEDSALGRIIISAVELCPGIGWIYKLSQFVFGRALIFPNMQHI